MSDLILGFLSGICVTLVGALAGSIFQRHNEEHRRKERASFEVYMHLMGLNSIYFWVASAEIRGEAPPPEQKERALKVAWLIADKLRETENIEYLEDTLEILFGSKYKSANDRANALNKIIDRYALLVNPRYAKIIKRISQENIMALAAGQKSNAPGSFN